MRKTTLVSGCALAFAVAFSSTGSAQEEGGSYLSRRVAAPSDALELKVGTGYTQGFGNIGPGRRTADSGGPGFGVGVDLDYRITRDWSAGVEGQYQAFGDEFNTGAQGAAFNVGATYHFMPVSGGDPWLRVGTGYRLYWENNPSDLPRSNTVLRHGFQALTAKLGYDVRLSEDVALGPVIGADLSLFTFQDSSAVAASTSTFVYGGVQGRFDVGGDRVGGRTAAYVPPAAPVGVTAPQPQAPEPMPMTEETEPASQNISVSKDIISACKMSIDAKVPNFEYDQADLSQSDMDVIKKVAECFTTGPMKDQKLYLVGRADPRGNAEYNDTLAMKRATEVATHLQEQGVASEKIDRTSRGARDARGTDEATWAADRRVDILVR